MPKRQMSPEQKAAIIAGGQRPWQCPHCHRTFKTVSKGTHLNHCRLNPNVVQTAHPLSGGTPAASVSAMNPPEMPSVGIHPFDQRTAKETLDIAVQQIVEGCPPITVTGWGRILKARSKLLRVMREEVR